MSIGHSAGLLILVWVLAFAAACGESPSATINPTQEPAAPTAIVQASTDPTAVPQAPYKPTAVALSSVTSADQLYIFSNLSPHVSVIDTSTNEVVRTADIPNFTSWTWNDNNNYFDGQSLWLGTRDPSTNDVEIISLDLDTLEITSRVPIGQDRLTLYIGKPTGDGVLLVSKMGSGEVVAIDTKTSELLSTWDVPVHGDVVCDADIAIGPDGVERFYYPTRGGDTLVSINPATGETLNVVETPPGSEPLMLTTAPNGTVWVQEASSNTNAVFDPVTLELLKRFPTGKRPMVASFDAEGRYGFIGHGSDTIVTVIDAEALKEVQRIQVGTNPQKLAIETSGRHVYAILTREGSVAVIDNDSCAVTERVSLGTNPTGIFLRPGS